MPISTGALRCSASTALDMSAAAAGPCSSVPCLLRQLDAKIVYEEHQYCIERMINLKTGSTHRGTPPVASIRRQACE